MFRCSAARLFQCSLVRLIKLITHPLDLLIARSMGRDDWNDVRGALCKSANEIMLSTIVTRGFEFECHTVFRAIA